MKAISRWVDRFCYNHPNFGIPELMKYIMIGNLIVFVGDMATNGLFSWFTCFYPELILKGQVWRLVSFVFTPMSTGGSNLFTQVFFFALTAYFYYWIGTALERQWGTTRFTVFYGLGVLLNLILGLVIYAIQPITAAMTGGYYYLTATMHYVNLSMFFSFATLYPDMMVLLYGIIPLKVKWIAWLDVGLFIYEIVLALLSRSLLGAVWPIVAILNYLIFFWESFGAMFRRGQQRIVHKTNPQTINFKKAQKEVQQRKGYLHKCAICGITDADDPTMEFRYCSKCSGYHCYCMNHINNHTHVN